MSLQLAIEHISHNTKKLLSDYDNQIIKLLHGKISKQRESTEKSLLDFVIYLSHNKFSDNHIKAKLPAFIEAKKYLDNIKENWKLSFSENFIDKYQDPNNKSKSQIFVTDLEKRNQKLKEFVDGGKVGGFLTFLPQAYLCTATIYLYPQTK